MYLLYACVIMFLMFYYNYYILEGDVVCYQAESGAVGPPTTWQLSPILTNLNNKYNYSETLYLLHGLRISSQVLNAIIWAAEERGELSPSNAFQVLDATMIFNVSFSQPKFVILGNDSVTIRMEQSSINGTCYETGYRESELSPVLEMAIFNLTGNGTVDVKIDDDSKMFIVITVDNFDLDKVSPNLYYPPIPLPSTVIEQLMIKLLNETIPYLNDWLEASVFEIPSDIAQFMPNPVHRVVHQKGMCQ